MTEQRFSSQVYADRLARAAAVAGEAQVDALIVGPGPDLEYLTGSKASTFERLTALVVPASGAPWVVVPRLELAALRASAVGELGIDTRDWVDGEDPYASALDGIAGGAVVAVSDALPALHLIPLADRLGSAPILATPVLSRLRMIKDPAEIDALRRAGAAIDRVHARMGEFLIAGRTERQVADDITAAIIAEGHTEAAFVIVGSGPNGADPHHEVSDRVITTGDVVVIDIGGPVAPGYNSDSTRTYVIGAPSEDVAAQVAILERAQQAAVDAVRPGARAHDIDAAARDVLVDAGLGEQFIHRTGHGIGLSVHEEPYIVAGSDVTLETGMAFSIEPGIYFSGQWGARIEDIVVVTDSGCEPVNTRPHALTKL
ncbi:Xaa-Pro peptidase family protein [Williamsia sp.]|uniref:M24 family metallopeptidase n=1 Tax=Williamsia sp. TaxID=1872085 RepID=UPI001A2C6622|nr:Xaa-Pro peptidase family protein [Williamsia sp.]MBJ7289130.1 aminopeptidase P family protein [Williamsia sp.]